MGKRSNFERIERDFYPTPKEAVLPLLPHVEMGQVYVEPCAGDGALIHALYPTLECSHAYDIEPRAPYIIPRDALAASWPAALYVTNPPWRRDILHPLIDRLTENGGSAWLLFDADWMHTKQAIPYLGRCQKIVSIGRVKWIPDSKTTGKDNCCWYYFTQEEGPTEFYGRS